MKSLLLFISTIALTQSAMGYADYCSRNRSYENVIKPKCIGGKLPSNRLRNVKANSHEIVCTGNVDNYVRRPQKLDLDEWEALVAFDKQEAQDFAWKSLPDIKWKGVTTFNTVETWKWESCELVTSGSDCGYDTETYVEQVSYTDSKGNIKYKSVTKTRQVPKSCYVDVEHTEYQHCSTEKMEYSAEYLRPNKKTWNPSNPNYYDQIPLKYDLLPGESEAVQTFSTDRSYVKHLNPAVKIPNGWNVYNIKVNAGGGFKCDQLKAKGIAPYKFSAAIETVKRDVGKQSPNAFKLPVDFDGNPLEVIRWASDTDKKGKRFDKAYPQGVQLIDTAASMVNMMAEQSRQNADVEQAKYDKGLLTNQDGVEITDQGNESFFKNTQVKVRIVDRNNYWFDNQFGKVYTDDVKSTKASLNAISESQEIARSDLWMIELNGETKGKDDIYDGWNLKPNKDDYFIEISMYQKGVPFYNQSCENDLNPPGWACNKFVRWLGMGRQESDYFSEPLSIQMKTGEYDKRGFFKKIINFFGYR